MSPVGHSIVGLTFATLAADRSSTRRRTILLAVSFVALASLPDWPIPGWGHDRYDISHSIFVNTAMITVVISAWKFFPRLNVKIPPPCLVLGLCAWLSHLLLDSLYNHGRGVAIYWPVSEGRLNFAVPWFSTIDKTQAITSSHNLSVFAIEFLSYGPIFLATLCTANLMRRRTLRNELPANHS